ncbi:MAG: sigma-70 family RNA polymerase sigma factor [Oscillospiraceae bacterium]|jgi:RNA polymerase sigma factor (sigma-70 family)|nr:sigma-70 family RNA polymerase sigma factor [Oscillospiraceae bacterium]
MLPAQEVFLAALYRKNFGKIAIYAAVAMKDSVKAQDIAQDVFHEAILHIERLMIHDNPEGWLMQTAKNKIHENQRERTRYLQKFLSLDSDVFIEVFSLDEQEIHESNEISSMKKIAQALSPEEFHHLKRLVFDKASHKEVAGELGITIGASQKRLERIRKKLFDVFPERKKHVRNGPPASSRGNF